MRLDTATVSSPNDVVRTSNAEVIEQIRSHHSEMAAELNELTRAVLAAAASDALGTERDALHDWYRDQLIPHAVAEEHTLYSAAAELGATRLLICSMLTEHRTLVELIADLAFAREPFETAMIAASTQALLTSHLAKENDLLLPALDSAGLEMGGLLDGMHELLGRSGESAGQSGCGCGCAQDAGEDDRPVPVELTARPNHEPPPAFTAAASGAAGNELDLRILPHGQRHEIIFAKLRALAADETLVIVNDHDPKPLRYQTEAMWPDGRFEWTYRAAGPEVWRVAITRVG